MTLPTIAGVQSRIFTLPGRPPFMIADGNPAEIRGGWSWIQKSGVGLLATEVSEVTPSTHQARLSDTPARIREGWLKLSDALGKNDK